MKDYILTEKEGLTLVQFPHFINAGLNAHAVTTRKGGASAGAFESLNMGRKTSDDSQNIAYNQTKVAAALGFDPGSFVFSDQVHGTVIRLIDTENIHIFSEGVDGLITQDQDIALTTVYADCMPILLYDPMKRVIAMAHAGWRGTAAGIGVRLITMMKSHFKSRPEHILAALGPCIGPCCFEVGTEVIEGLKSWNVLSIDRTWIIEVRHKKYVDLQKVNRILLESQGLNPKAIKEAPLCTCCHPELFFSHRRDKGNTGRMAAVMVL